MPKLTIITAVRCDTVEKQAWFRECAESVLFQDFQDWEWVIVDDESPFPPEAPSDVRVRLVRSTSNQGPSTCRNTAVRLARTDAILPLDGDDKLAQGALSRLWAAYDPQKFVYGDIQLIEGGQPGRQIKFPSYTFEGSLKFVGNVPVTALHSVACWRAAGGWKTEFDAGLEDLEYWISAGAAGFCGLHLDGVTLMYRRHPQSRAQHMRQDLRQQEMENKVQGYHKDIYEGRYPMGCCGGRSGTSSTKPLAISNRPTRLAESTTVSGGKVWIRYNGRKQAEFQVRGSSTGTMYHVAGRGHEFEVYAADVNIFQRAGRGKDFSVGIAPPKEPEPIVVPQEKKYVAPEPVLAQIISVDPVARPPIEAQSVVDKKLEAILDVGSLELGYVRSNRDEIRAALKADKWTIPLLSRADPDSLTKIKGIGPTTAEKIIWEANELWQS